MREYYPVEVNGRDFSFYLIWYSDERDGILAENRKPILFPAAAALSTYAQQTGLTLEAGQTTFDFAPLENWLETPDAKIDCVFSLDAWNFFSDLFHSVGQIFSGDLDVGNTPDVYHKLFYGTNSPALRGGDKEHYPAWEDAEVKRLATVLSEGLMLLKQFAEIK